MKGPDSIAGHVCTYRMFAWLVYKGLPLCKALFQDPSTQVASTMHVVLNESVLVAFRVPAHSEYLSHKRSDVQPLPEISEDLMSMFGDCLVAFTGPVQVFLPFSAGC